MADQRPVDEAFLRFFRRRPKQSRSRAAVDAVVIAFEEFLQRGRDVDGVTVETLASRAGVAMGSFYEYFASKDSLLGVLIGRITRDNFDTLVETLEDPSLLTLPRVVEAMARATAQTYLTHPTRMRVLIEGITRLRLWGVVTAERDRFASKMAGRAEALVARPEGLEQTMRIVADATMGICASAALREGSPPADAVAAQLTDVALAIIRARHGQA